MVAIYKTIQSGARKRAAAFVAFARSCRSHARSAHAFVSLILATLVAALALAGAWWTEQYANRAFNIARAAEFQIRANYVESHARARLRALEIYITALRAALPDPSRVSLAEWDQIIANIDRPNHLTIPTLGAGYAALVAPENVTSYLAVTRLAGQPNYTIEESAGENGLFVQYATPQHLRAFSPGRDLLKMGAVRAALNDGIGRSGMTVAEITIDPDKRDGTNTLFLYLLPVPGPSGAPQGCIFACYHFDSVIGAFSEATLSDVGIQLVAQEAPAPPDSGKLISTTRAVWIGDRPWSIRIFSTRAAWFRQVRNHSIFIVAAGAIIAMLAGVVVLLVRQRQRTLARHASESEAAELRAKQQGRATALIATTADDGVLIADTRGVILWASEKTAYFTGRAPADLVERVATERLLGGESDKPLHETVGATPGESRSWVTGFSTAGMKKDRIWYEIEIRGICDTNGALKYYMILQRDITQRKASELQLAEARELAECLAREKSELIHHLTREARSHLTGILGMTREIATTKLTHAQAEMAVDARRSATALSRIFSDLQILADVQSDGFAAGEGGFCLLDIAMDVCDSLAPDAARRGLDIIVNIDPGLPRLRGDAGRVAQMLYPIVENAIKFTDIGEVVISASVALDADGSQAVVRLEVADTGIGIQDSEIETILKPFARGSNTAGRRVFGSGLGLAVSHQIIQKLSGRIRVASVPGRGSRFELEFPLGVAGQAEADPWLLGKNIFIVDSHDAARAGIAQILKYWGARVEEFRSNIAAVSKLEEGAVAEAPVDIIILKKDAPVLDGMSAATAIRAGTAGKSVPILMTAGVGPAAEMPDLSALLPAICIRRPLFPRDLRKAVQLLVDQPQEAAVPGAPLGSDSASEDGTKGTDAPIPPPGRGKELRGIVVDDDAVSLKVARAMLKKLGVKADIESDGFQAVLRASRENYQIVLMDLLMPNMDGPACAKAIRAAEGGQRKNVIIAMTAATDSQTRTTCLEAGMDDYITKPLQLEDLARALEKWVQGHDRHLIHAATQPTAGEHANVRVSVAPELGVVLKPLLARIYKLKLNDTYYSCETTVCDFTRGARQIFTCAAESLQAGDSGAAQEQLQRLRQAAIHFGAVEVADSAGRCLEAVQTGNNPACAAEMQQLSEKIQLFSNASSALFESEEAFEATAVALGFK